MSHVTLQLQGEAVTLTVPENIRKQLGLEPGQEMVVTASAGGLHLTQVDSELDRQLTLVDKVLAEQADVLRALASR